MLKSTRCNWIRDMPYSNGLPSQYRHARCFAVDIVCQNIYLTQRVDAPRVELTAALRYGRRQYVVTMWLLRGIRVTMKPMTWGGVLRRWRMRAWVALLCLTGFAGAAHAGYAAIVVDASSGQVLQQVNADQRDYPASLTKMMTLYLTFQGLKSGKLQLDEPMQVSAHAANMSPTRLGLRAGQTISVRDCILGMITKSANDAAAVMAENIGGSEPAFADMMTAQAHLLGMGETHFANASGLPNPDNTSTAHDLVRLAMALYRDFPQYAHFFATQEFVFRGQIVRGHNHLMYRYPGMDGLKTGYIDASGFNLASTAVRNGRRLFAVVLGGRTAAVRDNLMARLLDDGFAGQETPLAIIADASRTPLPAVASRRAKSAHSVRVAARTHQSRSDRKVAAASACTRHTAACRRATASRRVRHAATTRVAAHHPTKKAVVVAARRQVDG